MRKAVADLKYFIEPISSLNAVEATDYPLPIIDGVIAGVREKKSSRVLGIRCVESFDFFLGQTPEKRERGRQLGVC